MFPNYHGSSQFWQCQDFESACSPSISPLTNWFCDWGIANLPLRAKVCKNRRWLCKSRMCAKSGGKCAKAGGGWAKASASKSLVKRQLWDLAAGWNTFGQENDINIFIITAFNTLSSSVSKMYYLTACNIVQFTFKNAAILFSSKYTLCSVYMILKNSN